MQVPSWSVPAGQSVALIGPSGSGKTTLLHLLAGILVPARGKIRLGDVELTKLSESERRRLRLISLGLVFQEFELIEHLSLEENLLLPYRLHSALCLGRDERLRARQLAERLGLGDKLSRHPRALSQGERQRVAVGRALLLKPHLILADEPTGNLDPESKQRVMELLWEHVRTGPATLIVATHDYPSLAQFESVLDMHRLVQ